MVCFSSSEMGIADLFFKLHDAWHFLDGTVGTTAAREQKRPEFFLDQYFFLMFISLLPFTTSFLSSYNQSKVAIAIYWLNILMGGLILYISWSYAMKNNYVSSPDIPIAALDRAVRRRIIIAQTLYAIGALLCFVNNYISIFFIIAVQLNYAFAFFSTRKRK